jgi:hypothetical protein
MLFVSLAFSAVFLVIVNGIALLHRKQGVGRASLLSLAGIFALFFCTMTQLLPLNAVLVAVVGAVCWAVNARPRWFLASSLGATVAAYAIVALPDLWAWDRLKKDYPLESLAQRLAYEDRPKMAPAPADDASGSPAAARLAHLEARVKKEEEQFSSFVRTQSLERLHAGVVQQFIDSPGFGVGRMIHRPAPFRLERERQEESPIPQPIPAYPPADLAPAPLRLASELDLLTAHEDNTVDFLNPVGFGYVQDREHVAGFRPHQFRNQPQAPQRWRVGRLELVGLRKYAEPVVYQSANFPRMDELSQAPTRPLDAFEKEALARLRRGEDLMVQEASQQMRILGSIRAVPQCRSCHRVQGGELLGAFSYQLSPG